MPQLIRHVQIMYHVMLDAGTGVYVKIGTTGTGGMGLNIPYTHSEEKPSRVLLSKSAARRRAHPAALPDGPHARRPDHQGDQAGGGDRLEADRLRRDPARRPSPIPLVDADPRPPRATFPASASGPTTPPAGRATGRTLESVFIDTGENGVFSLEEFSAITTGEQMEFVTPEEIADVRGPRDRRAATPATTSSTRSTTRSWARPTAPASCATGPSRSCATSRRSTECAAWPSRCSVRPRTRKLLFEAHLLRAEYSTTSAVREPPPNRSAPGQPAGRGEPGRRTGSSRIGIPILLESGEILRGPRVKDPAERPQTREVTPERLERWVRDGWVDLRVANCAQWVQRFRRIQDEVARAARRRHLQPLPARPPLLERRPGHPARQDRGLDPCLLRRGGGGGSGRAAHP